MSPRNRLPRTALLAAMAISSPAAAQDDRLPSSAVQGTEVRVSSVEATITFPRYDAAAWGWLAGDGRMLRGGYEWRIFMEGEGIPRQVHLSVLPPRDARRSFPSLAALVAAGDARVCWPVMMITCDQTPVDADVRGGRVVLTLRDRAAIRRLFGLRPDSTMASVTVPGRPQQATWTTVPITYVAPQLPPPDAALRAEVAAARRLVHAQLNGGGRSIQAEDFSSHLWLTPGDSVVVRIEENRCQGDACSETATSFADARWSVDDGSVVRLREIPDTASRRRRHVFGKRPVLLTALRPGRTTIRISGLHSDLDTIPIPGRFVPEIAREIVVTGPVAAVRICPRPEEVPGGIPIPFRVELVDREGVVYRDPPANIVIHDGAPYLHWPAPGDTTIRFDRLGPVVLTTTPFAGLSDTVRLRVVAPRRGASAVPARRDGEDGCASSSVSPTPLPARTRRE
ncbi:MAG TPA: hypothetical protein VF092_23350 [Longimicrobium sp.]